MEDEIYSGFIIEERVGTGEMTKMPISKRFASATLERWP